MIIDTDTLQVITTVIAVSGFTLSLVNLARSTSNADRQYASGYFTEITRWAIDVLKLYKQISDTQSLSDREAVLQEFRLIKDELGYRHDIASLYIAKSSSETISELNNLASMLVLDLGFLRADGFSVDQAKYIFSRNKFIKAVRNDIGVVKRHQDARKYIS